MSEPVRDPAAAAPSRRRWLQGGVAVAALAAGAGAAWWRLQPGHPDAEALARLWELSFPTPGPEPLAMASLRGQPLLVNFWATWCAPCVEEMPLLDRFYQQHRAAGFRVVGLAVDQVASVQRFLARTPVTFPIGMAGLDGVDLSRSLGNQAGGLPFSVLVGADGRVRERRMGQLTEADLKAWLARA